MAAVRGEDGGEDGDDPEGDGERADRLSVMGSDGGDLGLDSGGAVSGKTFERMRFVFGIGDGRGAGVDDRGEEEEEAR